MKKIILLLLIIFSVGLLAGCSRLSNEEIIEQTKLCRDNGLEVREIINGFNYDTVKIICEVKE